MWGHWYPYFGLLATSKPQWVLSYSSLAEAYMLRYMFPEIHFWCNTCRPLGGQHDSWAISSTYLQGIGGTQNRELSCRHSQCEIRQARRSTDWGISGRLILDKPTLGICKMWVYDFTSSLLCILKLARQFHSVHLNSMFGDIFFQSAFLELMHLSNLTNLMNSY